MKENKDCKVVQDLLPNYIEKLTSEETNQFIKEHLRTCENCQTMLDNMQAEIKVDKVQQDDREVEYIKKFNVKFKKAEYRFFVLIYTILAILVATIVIYFGRKYIIIQDLLGKLDEYSSKTNYYVEEVNYYEKRTTLTKKWVKDDDAFILYTDYAGYKDKVFYEDGNAYGYEKGEKVSYETFYDGMNLVQFCGQLIVERQTLEDIKTIFNYSITEEILNGKRCYRFQENDQMGSIIYIEKETGLVVRFEEHGRYDAPRTLHIDKKQYNSFNDYEYKFDTVKDSDLDENLLMDEVAVKGKFNEKVELTQNNFKVSVSNVKFDSEKGKFYTDIEFTSLDNHTLKDGVYFDYYIENDEGYVANSLSDGRYDIFEDVPMVTKIDDKTVSYHFEFSNFIGYKLSMEKMIIKISNVRFPNSEYDEVYQDNRAVTFDKDFVFVLE